MSFGQADRKTTGSDLTRWMTPWTASYCEARQRLPKKSSGIWHVVRVNQFTWPRHTVISPT